MKWLQEIKKEQEAEQLQRALKNNTHLTSFFKKAPKDLNSTESPTKPVEAKNKIVCANAAPSRQNYFQKNESESNISDK